MTPRPLPNHIQPNAFDFRWDNTLLWQLDVPSEMMPVELLVWHFDIPWLHTPNGRFDVTPNEIMLHPSLHPDQYERTLQADLAYPIDVMLNKGRWLILDGLHRLMKASIQGHQQVSVRKIPRSMVPLIEVYPARARQS